MFAKENVSEVVIDPEAQAFADLNGFRQALGQLKEAVAHAEQVLSVATPSEVGRLQGEVTRLGSEVKLCELQVAAAERTYDTLHGESLARQLAEMSAQLAQENSRTLSEFDQVRAEYDASLEAAAVALVRLAEAQRALDNQAQASAHLPGCAVNGRHFDWDFPATKQAAAMGLPETYGWQPPRPLVAKLNTILRR